MTKRRKDAGASGSAASQSKVTKQEAAAPEPGNADDAGESFAEETSAETGTMGDAMETRVRNRRDERLSLDALDDVEVSMERDDLPADAVDEIAMSESPDEYQTSDSGVRRANHDDAEMGAGGDAHSPEELAQQVLGREPRGRGMTRDGEPQGLHLGLE